MSHTAGSCVFALLVLVVLGCGESKEARRQKFLERGLASLKQSNDEEAIYYFNQALDVDSCFADALNNIGTVHFNGRRFEDALRSYNKAIACNPQFIDGYFNRFNTRFLMHDYIGALEDIGKAISIKPDTAPAYFSRGLAYTELRRYEEAIASFEEAGRYDTTLRFDGQVNIASVNVRMRKYDEAEAILKICMGARPDEPNIHNSLGLVAIARGDLDEALRHTNTALRLAPEQPYFLNNRGYIYIEKMFYDLAESDINQSLTLDPYNGWAYRNKGILSYRKEDLVQAQRLLEHAASIDPDIDLLHYYLGMTYFKQGRKMEACQQLRLSEKAGENRIDTELKAACRGLE